MSNSTLDLLLPASAADSVPLGIVKVNRHQEVSYANRELLRIAGLRSWEGVKLGDVFRGEDLDKVRSELRLRIERGEANAYPVHLTRTDGKVVPISVTSFPELDAEGQIVGALAFVRDLTLETAQQRMYQHVEREAANDRLLDAIATELKLLVPFDRIEVLRLNQDRTHLRTIYPEERKGDGGRIFRWWRIPGSLMGFLNGKPLRIADLRAWYLEDPLRVPLLEAPEIKQFLEEGYFSVLSLPVSHNGRHMASLVLSRRTGKAFSPEEQQVAEALPLTEAVSVALRKETEGNLHFLLGLMADISSAYGTAAEVAQTIVQKISVHYGWDYVSIYQVHEDLDEIHLIAQKAKCEELEERQHVYPLGKGVIGEVFETRRGVVYGNLDADELKERRIQRRRKKTLSELCVPIGEDAHWLLNVEDVQAEAFAPEEKRDLEAIAAALQSLLKRTVEYQYRSAVVTWANDGIFLVDARHRVLEANAAAARLLRLPPEQIAGRPIREFFVDPEEAPRLLASDSSPNHEVRMRRPGEGEAPVRVLLSVAKLPEESEGWIFVASDMTLLERAQRLEGAQALYREVAGQVKTPMSLAITWLRRESAREADGTPDLARKCMQQLQKAELTLDRLMLAEAAGAALARHEVLLSADALAKSILDDLPARERENVQEAFDGQGALIRADAYEVRYCVETVLSYLLRLAPEDGQVRLAVFRDRAEVVLEVSGQAESALEDLGDACRSGQARTEIALGRDTLERLAKRNGGRYVEWVLTDWPARPIFRFAFPLDPEGARP